MKYKHHLATPNRRFFFGLLAGAMSLHNYSNAQIPATFINCGFDNTNGVTTNVTVAKPASAQFYNTLNPTQVVFGNNASVSASGFNEFEIIAGDLINNTGGDISHILVPFKGFGFWSQSIGSPPVNYNYFNYDASNQRWSATLPDGSTAYFYVLGATINGNSIPASDIKLMPFRSSANAYTLATTSAALPAESFTDAGTGIIHTITATTMTLPANLITADLGFLAASGTLTNVRFKIGLQITGGSTQDAWVGYNNESPDANPPGDYDYYVKTQLDLLYIPYDYGDAPAAYGTALHSITPCNNALYLGLNRSDYEIATNGSANANADDLNTSGYNDEDIVLQNYNIADNNYSATFPVTNRLATNAYLNAWIDWNDNQFFDASEMAHVTLAAGSTSATLTWKKSGAATGEGTIPATVNSTSSKIVRIRTASIQSEVASAQGTAADGEVEDMVLNITTTPTPVKFVYFKAALVAKEAVLDWQTVAEQNNRGFEIERSEDGFNWTKIGFVESLAGNGNSVRQQDYSFTDKHPVYGKNRYRLKQLDIDGGQECSTIQTIYLDGKSYIYIYPNPVMGKVTIEGLYGEEDIQIADVSGRVCYRTKAISSNNTIALDGLDNGLYFIQITGTDGARSTHKIVVSR